MSNINLISDILDITKTQNGQDGQPGAPGANGYNAATIFLYKRASGTTAPAGPTARLTYKFSDGSLTPSSAYTGWNRTMPADTGNPCWIAVAAAISNTDTDYIETTDWTIQKLVQDGTPGAPGTNGYNAATIYLYQRASTAPSVPTGLTYTFSTNTITGSLGSWTRTIPPSNVQKQPCYVTSAVVVSQQDSGNTLTFVQPTQLVEDGIDAMAYTVRTDNEDILKFINEDSIYTNRTYNFSINELQMYAYDLQNQLPINNTAVNNNEPHKYAILDVEIADYKLKQIIKAENYSRYVEIKEYTIEEGGVETTRIDDISYYFRLDNFYADVMDNNSPIINYLSNDYISNATVIVNAFKNFFYDTGSVSIHIYGTVIDIDDSIYQTEKYILLKNGLSEEMLKFSINAGGLNTAIQNTKLHFDANGLTITNGGFKIYTQGESGQEPVLSINPDTHQLIMNGSGTFNGRIEADAGYFKGTLTAVDGTIGGFLISKNSIESQSKNLQLFSYINIDPGIIEQGSIGNNSHGNMDSEYRVRTQGYIPVKPNCTYIINSNLPLFLIENYSSTTTTSFVSKTDWIQTSENGYSYTIPNNVNYFRILLAKNSGTNTQKVNVSEVEFFTIFENNSLIKAENISIGDGGVIDGYLKVGNLSLINPARSNDNAVLKLEVPNDETYFTLTNEGYIIGPNWSIMKEDDIVTARFGNVIAEGGTFNGTIHAIDGTFSGAITASTINATTLNTVNFITENVRSMGGSFVFKPTFAIQSIEDKNNSTLEFTLDGSSTNYFSEKEAIDLKDWFIQGGISTTGNYKGNYYSNTITRICMKDFFEVFPNEKISYTVTFKENSPALGTKFIVFYDENKQYLRHSDVGYSTPYTIDSDVKYIKIVIGSTGAWNSTDEQYRISPANLDTFYLNRYPIQIVTISGVDTKFGKISSINQNKIQVLFNTTDYNVLKQQDALKDYQTLTLFGAAYHDLLIGINSDNFATGNILPPRALVMRSFTDSFGNQESGDSNYYIKLLLGDLSSLGDYDSSYKNLTGYGLYANNVYLHGSLITTDDGNSSFAGVNTQRDVAFDYATWSSANTENNSQTYENDRIVFWGGAEGYNIGSIQTAPFIVTDKGNIFARSGEFKGTVISDSVITQSIIKAPIIYGSDDSPSAPSLKIYDTNTSRGGISFYKKNNNIDGESNEEDDEETLNININGFIHKDISFISFNDTNNSASILYNGTQYTANTTVFKQYGINDVNAKVEVNGSSYVKLSYNTNHGIEISGNSIKNFGGSVQNEGTMSIYTTGTVSGQTVNTQELNYKVLNGYYCLFVTGGA